MRGKSRPRSPDISGLRNRVCNDQELRATVIMPAASVAPPALPVRGLAPGWALFNIEARTSDKWRNTTRGPAPVKRRPPESTPRSAVVGPVEVQLGLLALDHP